MRIRIARMKPTHSLRSLLEEKDMMLKLKRGGLMKAIEKLIELVKISTMI